MSVTFPKTQCTYSNRAGVRCTLPAGHEGLHSWEMGSVECVLVKITVPNLTGIEVGQETETRWSADVEIYGPASRAICEAAGAKIDQETHIFTVTEMRSLDDLPNDTLGDAA